MQQEHQDVINIFSHCVEVPSQNTVFTVFSVILRGSDATDEKNMAIFIISVSKSTRNDVLFFVLRNFSF